ncbi:MAG: hypothetical protein V3R81_00230, partial [Gammaproteobacteria bacterium]
MGVRRQEGLKWIKMASSAIPPRISVEKQCVCGCQSLYPVSHRLHREYGAFDAGDPDLGAFGQIGAFD